MSKENCHPIQGPLCRSVNVGVGHAATYMGWGDPAATGEASCIAARMLVGCTRSAAQAEFAKLRQSSENPPPPASPLFPVLERGRPVRSRWASLANGRGVVRLTPWTPSQNRLIRSVERRTSGLHLTISRPRPRRPWFSVGYEIVGPVHHELRVLVARGVFSPMS